MNLTVEKRRFYKELFAIVLPITIQNFLNSAVNFADVFMIGFAGQKALAAVSLANQYQFLLQGLFFGMASGVTILCSQYWGKQDMKSIQAVMGIAWKITMAVTAVIAFLAFFFPKNLMLIYTNDMELVKTGAVYLRIAGISYFIAGISSVYESTLKSIERAHISTLIASMALILNVILNAIFIFGLCGFPKMGVLGAALATLIARIAELVFCLIDMRRGKVFQVDLRIVLGRHPLLFRDFLNYSLPALANDILWTLAFSSYSVILGHLNSDMVAANAITTNVRELCTILCFGISGGGSVLLGKRIGERKMEEAEKTASWLCQSAFAVGVITGGIILLIRPLIPHLFDLTPRAESYMMGMLLISSYYIIGQDMNTLLIAGIFRAGGNTRFGLICDTVTMWVVSVPLGVISAFVLHLPPMTVYFILCLDEFWKVPVVIRYYKSKKWLKNITREYE